MSQWAAWGQYQQWSKPVRWLVAVLLVIALAFVLAQTFWLLWYGPNEPIPSNSKTRLQVASAGQTVSLSQSQVDSWQLFGSFEQVAPQSDKPTDAPETRLRLELLGVFQTADTEKASAIIAEKGKEGELYRIGDSIPGNASLEEVYPDRVILRRAGRLETLRWSDSSLGGSVRCPGSQRWNVSPSNRRLRKVARKTCSVNARPLLVSWGCSRWLRGITRAISWASGPPSS